MTSQNKGAVASYEPDDYCYISFCQKRGSDPDDYASKIAWCLSVKQRNTGQKESKRGDNDREEA